MRTRAGLLKRGGASWRNCDTLRRSCCAAALLASLAMPAMGAGIGEAELSLADMPLERLLDVTVVSASRKTQALGDVSSAVFVINQEDIRRSGATTIPDVLRMVPGMQVASIDGNTWAVSVRGFNGVFARNLLVMIDGRSVYSPLYGGVFWDVQDTQLQDIERIEVIRGPGSTMWGANAVNGVINIITKNAHDTLGGFAAAVVGDQERGSADFRYGGRIGDAAGYRVYLKHTERDDSTSIGLPVSDGFRMTRGGFRVDSDPLGHIRWTVQGDLYNGTADNSYNAVTPVPPYREIVTGGTDLFGGNLLSRLDWVQSGDSKYSFQMYYDRTNRDLPILREYRDTLDLDLQHNYRFAGRHELTYGAGWRFLHDRTWDKGKGVVLDPDSRSDQLYNLFIQDEITLLPETLRFTVGSKFEHNEYTGWEVQPSARISWLPAPGYSFWGAVTRSVRTPSRSDQDISINTAVIPPNTPPNFSPLPMVVTILGNRDVDAETVVAYELGFRADLGMTSSVDIATFYNRYRKIIGISSGTPYLDGTQFTMPNIFMNTNANKSWGGEISFQWQPLDWWKLKGGYSFINFSEETGNDAIIAMKATPEHQGSLRSLMSIGRDVDLDIWGRYVAASSYTVFMVPRHIPAYVTLDVRLAWRPVAGVELSLVGKNLLEPSHLETISDMTDAVHEVDRTVYGKVTWEF